MKSYVVIYADGHQWEERHFGFIDSVYRSFENAKDRFRELIEIESDLDDIEIEKLMKEAMKRKRPYASFRSGNHYGYVCELSIEKITSTED